MSPPSADMMCGRPSSSQASQALTVNLVIAQAVTTQDAHHFLKIMSFTDLYYWNF